MDNPRLQAKRYPNEVAQTRRQADENILVGHDALLGHRNPAFFGGGLGAAQFAFVDRALEEQPGGNLHEPCRQTHAFDRIGNRRRARQQLRLLAAIAVEVGGRPAHQIHSLLEKNHELFGRRQLLAEGDGLIVSKKRRLNHHAPFVPEADRSGLAGKQSPYMTKFFHIIGPFAARQSSPFIRLNKGFVPARRRAGLNWTRAAGPLEPVSQLEALPASDPFLSCRPRGRLLLLPRAELTKDGQRASVPAFAVYLTSGKRQIGSP